MLGVAVIGYGYWGPNLLRNFYENSQVQVIMLADLNEQRLAVGRSRYPSVETTTALDQVLEDPRVHAVVIATPVRTHYDFASRALAKGKHVLIEKPIATSVREAEELIALAESGGLTLMVDHTFVYTNAVRKIKQLVDEGKLGDLYYFDSVRINLGLFQHDVNVLWDLAPHDLSILEYLIAEPPISVCAIGARHAGSGVESIAYLTVNFASGFLAHFHTNWLAPVKVRSILIGGSRRMVVFDDLQSSEKVKVYDRGVESEDATDEGLFRAQYSYRLGDVWSPNLASDEALKEVVKEFVTSCQTGRPPLTGGQSGLRVVTVLEAAAKSMLLRGQEVRI